MQIDGAAVKQKGGEGPLHGHWVLFRGDGSILELDRGGGRTTL